MCVRCVCARARAHAFTRPWGGGVASLHSAVVALECVCAFEVLQIMIGAAKGNLKLGVLLHGVRLLQASRAMSTRR